MPRQLFSLMLHIVVQYTKIDIYPAEVDNINFSLQQS